MMSRLASGVCYNINEALVAMAWTSPVHMDGDDPLGAGLARPMWLLFIPVNLSNSGNETMPAIVNQNASARPKILPTTSI